ncbi:VIT domain-containing protein [Luteimonas terrae]|uniref:Flp pilus assembly protein TadD n=1 Tax=Luteimonas terrae TaxID=1530191 RepID=A0ABU1XRY1_9GAMM|nr:VIT domain-containing protein [Luteimonas terrae]MDR7191521.1 Flp pilus assembly protein TadD [Luteimonas terrae]
MPRLRSCLCALLCLAVLLPTMTTAQRLPDLAAPALIVADAGESPVRLESASMRVDAGAGVARTTIDLVLRNPTQRVLEGNLQFPLAPGQQIVGFSLDIDGALRDAVPVPKDRGREVFETIVREGVDPGLLEHTAGDAFRLRVYPFAPGGTRHVRLVLMATLQREGRTDTVDLPLAFARGLDRIELTLKTTGRPSLSGLVGTPPITRSGDVHRVTLRAGDVADAGIATLRVPSERRPFVQWQRRDGATWFVADVPVDAADAPRALPQRIGLLWDSSMSGRERAHALEFALLDAYFRAAGDIEVELLRLRDVADAPVKFQVRDGDWRALRRELESTVYDGASAAGGWTPSAGAREFLLFGDGLFNHGAQSFPAFDDGQRLYAVQSANGDATRLAALAQARGGRAIPLRTVAALPAATRALLRDAPRLEAIDGTGARDLVAESNVAENGILRIAGRLDAPHADLTLVVHAGGRTQRIPLSIDAARTPQGELAALQWARFQLAALQAEPERNRQRIAALGQRFGLVTPGTSLLVLERIEDYVRFDIEAPASIADAVASARAQAEITQVRDRQTRRDAVARGWAERIAWWARVFPKDAPPKQIAAPQGVDDSMPPAPPAPAPMAAAAPMVMAEAASSPMPLDRTQTTASRARAGNVADASSDAQAPAATIRLNPWQSDAPLARRLREAPDGEVYARYLDARDAEVQGTAFYLDAADVLQRRGETALALRVLSNLAELDVDNPHVLRVLAYRLRELQRDDLAVPVLERVLAMRPEEPQSLRDLALAYAATGERQRAVHLLADVVDGDWNGRFAEIELTALAELNALIATAATPLDTSAIDPRLLRNLPLDLRAVLSWDSDDSDMDLWVTDPDGEKAYYGNRLTRQGARMSPDFTRGYGPEEFALRDAKPGTYRVEANFFGQRQQVVTGATTLTLWLSTGFGTAAQTDQRVTLRLSDARETVFVGAFEVE